VLINVILVETFEDLDRDLGIEWGGPEGIFGTLTGSIQETEWPFRTSSAATDAGLKDFLGNVGNTLKDTAKQFNPTVNSGATTSSGTRDFSDFQVVIRALEDARQLRILAKPKILALDNQPALIKIATEQAIGSSTVTTGGGAGTTSTSTERYEVGTILRVTPLINTGGFITLTLEPSFATVENSSIRVNSVGGGSTGDPTTRTARTTLMINDGQTVALGGMLFSNQSGGDRKVPFFGNIPLIGKAFFTSTTKSLKDRELILFVTPYIITNPSMLADPNPPEQRTSFNEEAAPFWKVKGKRWYKELKGGSEEKTDFEGYFNVRRKLIDSTLYNLDQTAKVPTSSQT
jgi:general secretion pathway protein D